MICTGRSGHFICFFSLGLGKGGVCGWEPFSDSLAGLGSVFKIFFYPPLLLMSLHCPFFSSGLL